MFISFITIIWICIGIGAIVTFLVFRRGFRVKIFLKNKWSKNIGFFVALFFGSSVLGFLAGGISYLIFRAVGENVVFVEYEETSDKFKIERAFMFGDERIEISNDTFFETGDLDHYLTLIVNNSDRELLVVKINYLQMAVNQSDYSTIDITVQPYSCLPCQKALDYYFDIKPPDMNLPPTTEGGYAKIRYWLTTEKK